MEQYGIKLPGVTLLPELSVYTRTTPPGILLWAPCGLLLPLLATAPKLTREKKCIDHGIFCHKRQRNNELHGTGSFLKS
jgi:hypothetical protein